MLARMPFASRCIKVALVILRALPFAGFSELVLLHRRQEALCVFHCKLAVVQCHCSIFTGVAWLILRTIRLGISTTSDSAVYMNAHRIQDEALDSLYHPFAEQDRIVNAGRD